MNESRIGSEIGFVLHLVTIVTLTIFSAVLIVLNVLLGWEKWMIPVIASGLVLCLAIHISGKGTPRVRIYSYAIFMLFEAFYYAVNINTLYDSTALILIMVFIFAMSGERLLVLLGTGCGLAGMIMHIMLAGSRGDLKFNSSNIVRSVWQFVLIVLGAALADRLSAAWFNTEKHYKRRIENIIEENERANNFLANVSHEIRTPVNAVMGLAAIMEKEDIPDRIKGNVSAIAEAGHRVADQIGDIMDYTEIDMKKLSVSHERYMINSVVNDLISQLRFTEDYGLDLVIDLSPDVPAELIGDDSKIKKIIRHLITNGFKFTRTGGVNLRIFAKKREYGINLVLEVTDTGVGMTDTEIEHIYEKFYQSDSGRSRTAGGLGLGIPIVNGLARSMGGFLHIESSPGQGSLVRVSIPQEVSDVTPCITVADRNSIYAAGFLSFMTTSDPRIKEFHMQMVNNLVSGLGISFTRVKSREELEKLVETGGITHLFVGTGEYVENKAYIDGLSEEMNVVLVEDRDYDGTTGAKVAVMKKPFYGTQVANFLNLSYISSPKADAERMTCPGIRALVVDDEPMNLLVARGIFDTYGMEVFTASGGAEAIEMCGTEDYDIIFMDHMMPGMDGVETMKRLRLNAGKVNKELCIVALTANAISSSKEMFLSEGFDAFLPKPIELMELERVLKHVLPRSAIVYENQEPHDELDYFGSVVQNIPVSPQPEDDPFAELGEYGVDVAEGLGYCQNDAEFYKEILGEFAKDSGSKLSLLDGFFADKNWNDYSIRVHSVKSTAKTIGADALSESAKQLELASKAEDSDFVAEHHAAFMRDYGRLMRLINGEKSDEAEEEQSVSAPEQGSSDGEDSAPADEDMLEFAPETGAKTDSAEPADTAAPAPAHESGADTDSADGTDDDGDDEILEFSPGGGV